jgi:hypothetical protein
VGEEGVLVPIIGEAAREGELFAVNEVGAFIWERLCESQDVAEIVRQVVERFEVEEARAARDVEVFLAQLLDAGCVGTSGAGG